MTAEIHEIEINILKFYLLNNTYRLDTHKIDNFLMQITGASTLKDHIIDNSKSNYITGL